MVPLADVRSAMDETIAPPPFIAWTLRLWPARSTVTPDGMVTTPFSVQSVSPASVIFPLMVSSADIGRITPIATATAAANTLIGLAFILVVPLLLVWNCEVVFVVI